MNQPPVVRPVAKPAQPIMAEVVPPVVRPVQRLDPSKPVGTSVRRHAPIEQAVYGQVKSVAKDKDLGIVAKVFFIAIFIGRFGIAAATRLSRVFNHAPAAAAGSR